MGAIEASVAVTRASYVRPAPSRGMTFDLSGLVAR
jgi:hypothetical protein